MPRPRGTEHVQWLYAVRYSSTRIRAISIDNKTMFITICEFISRDYDNCDIYMSTRVGDGWSELKSLGPNINGVKTWESQPSISADGKTLYFASIRESNVGFSLVA